MKGRVACILSLVAIVSLALVASVQAQAKPDPTTGLFRIEGSVTAIDKEKTLITIKESSSANVTWSVMYTKDTVFTLRNDPAKLETVEVGRQIVCLGKIPDPEKAKTHMTAVRVEVRTQ
jgi:hypothetical protein